MTITFTNEQLQTILSALEDRLTKLTYMRKFEEFSLHYDDETNKAIALADEIYSYLETYKEEMEYLGTKFDLKEEMEYLGTKFDLKGVNYE